MFEAIQHITEACLLVTPCRTVMSILKANDNRIIITVTNIIFNRRKMHKKCNSINYNMPSSIHGNSAVLSNYIQSSTVD